MEKEKQIEEMARALCGKSYNAEKGFCNKFDTECDFMCNAYMKSKRVYALGYGNVKEAVKEFAERVKKRIEIDKYTPEITKDYDEEDKNNCEYYNLGLNHAQIIIDFFVKEVCGD